ncbi:MAG: hypothetical protein ABIP95_00470 [Pelobium sp.]
MGALIFIIFPIAYFFYQAYVNFKKEQEKALQRQKKSYVPFTENSNKDQYLNQSDAENPEEAPFNSRDFYKNKRVEELAKQAEIRAQRRAYVSNEARDYYNPEVPVAEVSEGRRIHALHPHQFEFPHEEKEVEFEFNLREAVIQQAILNRPQY